MKHPLDFNKYGNCASFSNHKNCAAMKCVLKKWGNFMYILDPLHPLLLLHTHDRYFFLLCYKSRSSITMIHNFSLFKLWWERTEPSKSGKNLKIQFKGKRFAKAIWYEKKSIYVLNIYLPHLLYYPIGFCVTLQFISHVPSQ